MKRRKGREYAFQLLFRFDFTRKTPDKRDVDEFWTDKEGDPEIREFAEDIVYGTIEHLTEIDSAIRKAAEHWALERMASADRNILRSATYELLYRRDIPSTVTINEAIEIAKRYSTNESAPFINGILDTIAKGIEGKKVR